LTFDLRFQLPATVSPFVSLLENFGGLYLQLQMPGEDYEIALCRSVLYAEETILLPLGQLYDPK
jgi:hypothetical protein